MIKLLRDGINTLQFLHNTLLNKASLLPREKHRTIR